MPGPSMLLAIQRVPSQAKLKWTPLRMALPVKPLDESENSFVGLGAAC